MDVDLCKEICVMDKSEIKIGMEIWHEDTYGNVRSSEVIDF